VDTQKQIVRQMDCYFSYCLRQKKPRKKTELYQRYYVVRILFCALTRVGEFYQFVFLQRDEGERGCGAKDKRR
jgi:hypothetical protein